MIRIVRGILLIPLASLCLAQVTITEFPISTPGQPEGIVAAPDGALWFLEENFIERITTAGVITNTYAVPTSGSEPDFIIVGPDSNLWFTEYLAVDFNHPNAARVTTGGSATKFPAPDYTTLNGIAAGPDGALWYLEGDNLIIRITTAGIFTNYYSIPTASSVPEDITAGPDGALWFTELVGNKIGRLTTGGSFTEYPVPTAASDPSGIAAGPDGALWFTEAAANKIGRITTNGWITEYPLPTADSEPNFIVAGPDGAIWFTEYAGRIGRITTAGTLTEYTLPTSGSGPNYIAAGPDGNIWFTEYYGNQIGKVALGTPQTITFAMRGDVLLGSPVPPLSATASSGLGVTFTPNFTSVCTVSGVNITLVGAGTCSITATQPGNSTYAAAPPFTRTFTVSPVGMKPVSAFLDRNGAPALTFNGSMNFPDAGGYLIGAPGVAQAASGDTYVVGLDSAGGVHLNSYSFGSSAWNGWQYSGGILDTSSGLTAAVDPAGVVWFTGRDIGNRYWINSWNGAGFGGWILLDQGIFASDSIPQIAIPSDGTVYVIGRDSGGRIWSNSYSPANQTFSGWVDRQAVMIGQPSVTAGQDGHVYVAVRSVSSNSPVYITRIPAGNAGTANTWLNGGGQIDTDPQITSQGGTVYLMSMAGGGTVYLLNFGESTQTFGGWSFTNGILNDATIAAAVGNIFIAGRDSLDRIYWYSLTGNSWFFAGGAGVSSTMLAGGK